MKPARGRCPICRQPSKYNLTLDRFFHIDGSDNDPCWLQMLRNGAAQENAASPHALYRFWRDDELLYIGITMDPTARFTAHRHDKRWWTEVNTITIAPLYPSREDALLAEQVAIISEKPKYNIVGNS